MSPLRRSRKSETPRKYEGDIVATAGEEVIPSAANRRKNNRPVRCVRTIVLRSGRTFTNEETPKKRTRGRPRKNENKPAKGKRPRGRPPKLGKKAAKGTGRRPGRPRKIIDEARTLLIIIVDPKFKYYFMLHSVVGSSGEGRCCAHRSNERGGSAHDD